jgi:transcriptional regulator with XRE-family HTH domain
MYQTIHYHATTIFTFLCNIESVDKSLKLFTDNSKAIMAEKNISQAELARRLNKPPSNVSRYLSGEIIPGLIQMQEFADGMEVPLWQLLKEPEEDAINPENEHALWFLRKVIVDKQRLRALSLLLIADNEMFETIEDAIRPFFKMGKGKNLSAG